MRRTSAGLDPDSRAWLARLRAEGGEREDAVRELRAILLRAARWEVRRRGGDRELAEQAADDAVVAILGKLDTYRGDSRFTTWAYKFALLQSAVAVRRRSWEGRELPLADDDWPQVADRAPSPHATVETRERLAEIRSAIESVLTPHQREVLVALALNEVPIDVLAERLGTTRGALYKTLHDARRKLRAHLEP